jgi:hypothetical protein
VSRHPAHPPHGQDTRPPSGTTASGASPGVPRRRLARTYTVVVPLADTGRGLGDLLASLALQTADTTSLETLCLDGGTNGRATRACIETWRKSLPNLRWIPAEGLSHAAACNLGIDLATSVWLTFCEAEEFLDPAFLAAADRFLSLPESARVGMVCCRRLFHADRHGSLQDSHHLRRQFASGPRWMPARDCGEWQVPSITSVVYDRAFLDRHRLRLKDDIRPFFADTEFNIACILAMRGEDSERDAIGVLPEAVHVRRLRGNAFSFADTFRNDPAFHTEVFDLGYARTLKDILGRLGHVPAFAQRMVLTSFMAQAELYASTRGAASYRPFTTAKALRDRFARTLALCDPGIALREAYGDAPSPMGEHLVERLLGVSGDTLWISALAFDPWKGWIKMAVTGDAGIAFCQKGAKLEILHERHAGRRFLDETFAPERLFWLRLRDRRSPVETAQEGTRFRMLGRDMGTTLDPRLAEEALAPGRPCLDARRSGPAARIWDHPRGDGQDGGNSGNNPDDKDPLAHVGTSPGAIAHAEDPYRDCWLFIDGPMEARENAEHLCLHVVRHHPEINAWFVMGKDAPDRGRLLATGARILDCGSPEHIRALASCAHLVSSNIESRIAAESLLAPRTAPFSFTLASHGILKGDMSAMYARARIDLICVMTYGEAGHLLAEGGPYRFTAKEVALTGLPRIDALLSRTRKPERRLLIMPTWRGHLPVRLPWERPPFDARDPAGRPCTGGFTRSELETLLASDFIVNWRRLLHAEELRTLAERHGYGVTFRTHPHVRCHLPLLAPPPWIDVPDIAASPTPDLQEDILACSILLTDYSTVAFTAACLPRKIVYWQFDRAEHLSGSHNMEVPGWFDYERDGFGPVTEGLPDLLRELELGMVGNGAVDPVHLERIEATFPYRDTGNCERTFRAIRALREP